MPDQAGRRRCGVGVWVWLGGTLLLLVRTDLHFVGVGLGALLGPEETPVRVLLGVTIPGLAA